MHQRYLPPIPHPKSPIWSSWWQPSCIITLLYSHAWENPDIILSWAKLTFIYMMSKCFSFWSLELLQLLTCWKTRFQWFLTKGSEVYIARKVAFISLWIRSCEKRCLTHDELLNTGMQLPGYVSAKLSPRCFTPRRDVNGSIQQVLEVQPLQQLILNLNKVKRNWHLPIDDRMVPS